LGWDGSPDEEYNEKLLRGAVIGGIGHYGYQPAIDEAIHRFNKIVAGDFSAVDPDLRQHVYKIALANHPDPHLAFEQLLLLFKKTDLQEEKVRCLRAFGSSKSKEVLQRTLDFALSTEVRSQDATSVITSVAGNLSSGGSQLVWDFFKKHWESTLSKYTGFLLASLVKETCCRFSSSEKSKEISEFFEKYPSPHAKRAVQQSLEQIALNTAWKSRDFQSVTHWLEHTLLALTAK